MRFGFIEDRDGEVDSLSLEDLCTKLYTGFVRMSDAVMQRKADMILKAGGQVDALGELRQTLHDGFKARLDAIREEINKGGHGDGSG